MKPAKETKIGAGEPSPSPAGAKKAGHDSSVEATATGIIEALDDAWLPHMYRERILTMRTRAHRLEVPAKRAPVEVQHTLLGVELKVGRRRLSCPDLATARYLAVFARGGCAAVAVPYDITRTSPLADDLESAWQRMLLLIEHFGQGRSSAFRTRVRATLLNRLREEIELAGAGTLIPHFNQNTKQRQRHV